MKPRIRQTYRSLRKGLSQERAFEAEKKIYEVLMEALKDRGQVLSYYSIDGELSMKLVNAQLAKEGRLCLPKMVGNVIKAHLVSDIVCDLVKGSHSFLEPDIDRCPESKTFDCCLVPAIAYDKRGHRVGFGKGSYDRLMEKCPNVLYLGVAFKEQLIDEDLSVEEHDRCVTKYYVV